MCIYMYIYTSASLPWMCVVWYQWSIERAPILVWKGLAYPFVIFSLFQEKALCAWWMWGHRPWWMLCLSRKNPQEVTATTQTLLVFHLNPTTLHRWVVLMVRRRCCEPSSQIPHLWELHAVWPTHLPLSNTRMCSVYTPQASARATAR